ncbi:MULTISPECIES: peroxiredoxin [Halobacteriovorax]|uniref:thioredoxin-dependent peroxiredoxin n=1 Tax=Halobacteriovorax vibrionivorans TaxID=2152716 RepID=A0ABY0IFW0_9BACT|nr:MULTISPECIES: peroxiredoxin [Halobacteriovorax]AYF43610.1 redoxin [Halobacteriovorax sp. BALOs_7]RZF21823.1 peroxiredoxin [Halobacteriovorax vibrionivorans]TGD48342.1 peroxiredoxin [Halobacteriovorax sp. Y22]
MKRFIQIPLLTLIMFFSAQAKDVELGQKVPDFTVKNHKGKDFTMASRKGKWTVLYFYPKAGTPGCTKQACAFRDSIKSIRKLGAEVYGISVDSVKDQAEFHEEHALTFDLLSDESGEVTKKFGAKMAVFNMSKRWTFIIDPNLKIVALDRDVDPMLDADKVSKNLAKLQSQSGK